MKAVSVSQDDQSDELLLKLDLLLIDYRCDDRLQNSIFHIIYLLKILSVRCGKQ